MVRVVWFCLQLINFAKRNDARYDTWYAPGQAFPQCHGIYETNARSGPNINMSAGIYSGVYDTQVLRSNYTAVQCSGSLLHQSVTGGYQVYTAPEVLQMINNNLVRILCRACPISNPGERHLSVAVGRPRSAARGSRSVGPLALVGENAGQLVHDWRATKIGTRVVRLSARCVPLVFSGVATTTTAPCPKM